MLSVRHTLPVLLLQMHHLSQRVSGKFALQFVGLLMQSRIYIECKSQELLGQSITTDTGRSGHVGLCQLRTKQFCTQLTKAYICGQNVLHQLLLCYVSAHNQFIQYFILYLWLTYLSIFPTMPVAVIDLMLLSEQLHELAVMLITIST